MGSKECIREGVWLLFVFMGSKKCARDVSEVTAVFMGSKKYTREGFGCSLCLRVQKKCTRDVSEVMAVFMGSKNIPATMLVASRVCWFKKMYPRTELNGCV